MSSQRNGDRRAGRLDRASTRRGLAALFALVAVATCAMIPLRRPDDRLADLGVYWGAVRSVFAGMPLYDFHAASGDPFTYPPFAAVAMAPIMTLPFVAAGVLWTAATVVGIVGLGRLVAARVLQSPASRRTAVGWLVAIGLLVSAPGQSNVRFGQVSLLLVIVCLADLVGVVPARMRGVLIGLAAAIKLMPLLFIVHLLVVGRRREAARATAAFIGATGLAFVVLPSDGWTFWTTSLWANERIGDLAALGNQSLNGLLLRTGLPSSTRPILLAAGVVTVVVFALVRARAIERAGEPAAAAIIIGCTTLAASPVSWTHHQFWPLLAGMLLVAASGALRRGAGWALVGTMTVSLADIVSHLHLGAGPLFVAQNARILAICLICVAGLAGLRVPQEDSKPGPRRAPWLMMHVPSVAASVVVALVLFLLVPLAPADDPAFRILGAAEAQEAAGPCATADQIGCDGPILFPGLPVNYSVGYLETGEQVVGVAAADVARLTYAPAPGAPSVTITLHPTGARDGSQDFGFMAGNLLGGQLVAYAANGSVLGEFGGKLRAGP